MPQPRATEQPPPEPPHSREEQLEREHAGRRLTVPAAAVAAVLPLAGAVISGLAFRHVGPDDTSKLLAFHHHAGALTAGTILISLGSLALIPVLRYLFGATRYRRPELSGVALVCAIGGPVLLAGGQLVAQFVLNHDAAHFATHGGQTYPEAHKVLTSGALSGANAVRLAGSLALGFSFVMIALNAMRVGLLTRFMGILGIVTGVLFVIPIGSPIPIVQSFWLGAIAVLISGRWPNGVPPAWESAKAEPWPSQQEVREQREAAKGKGGVPGGKAAPAPELEPAPAAAADAPAHPASKKRKRKKKR